jgi:hypothetical protein
VSLLSAHVQQAGGNTGELVKGFLDGGQQLVVMLGRQLDPGAAQAADRRIRRGAAAAASG